MLQGIHILLTYACNFECDHCFLYCSPRSQGTFTLNQIQTVLDEGKSLGSVDWIFFEGGEPFLFFPLLQESIKRARQMGFKIGVVTNAYGAVSEEDAKLWLEPLAAAGLSYLSVSNDTFHYGDRTDNPAAIAVAVAERLGIDTAPICIDPPEVHLPDTDQADKGQPVVGGGAMFRGRAADKLIEGLPLRSWESLCQCPHEELVSPKRVHVDPFGQVHICQGISMGDMWQTPLSQLIRTYEPHTHPICGPLIRGGPAELVRAYGIDHQPGYVDECHLCFLARRAIIDRFPDHLAPIQVYGMD